MLTRLRILALGAALLAPLLAVEAAPASDEEAKQCDLIWRSATGPSASEGFVFTQVQDSAAEAALGTPSDSEIVDGACTRGGGMTYELLIVSWNEDSLAESEADAETKASLPGSKTLFFGTTDTIERYPADPLNPDANLDNRWYAAFSTALTLDGGYCFSSRAVDNQGVTIDASPEGQTDDGRTKVRECVPKPKKKDGGSPGGMNFSI